MNDKELLQLAAKAAGIDGEYVTDFDDGDYYYSGNVDGILYVRLEREISVWNPLTDDGDALRLAVKLMINIEHNYQKTVFGRIPPSYKYPKTMLVDENLSADPYAATRRAIVRAAAEIGRMK